jgi:hypothetical protein
MAAAWVSQLPRRHRGRVLVRFDVLSVYLVGKEPGFEHTVDAFPFREERQAIHLRARACL